MLQGLVILYLISFVLGVLIVVRVWRANTLDGVLTLFLPFYVFYALYKYWGDPETDIRWLLLAQLLVSCIIGWNILRTSRALVNGHPPAVAQEESQFSDDDDPGDDNRGATGGQTPAPVNKAASASTTTAAQSPAGEAEPPPRRATPEELQRVSDSVIFQRGRFVREAIGLTFDIPRGQHVLTAADARRVDTALRGENDVHLIGWMVAADKTVTSPNLRIVRMRWRHDGLVDANSASLQTTALLDVAHSRPRVPRLSGSDGTLVRYSVPPTREGVNYLWSEERKPEDMSTSVYDCHALHLARKGVLELSIVGVDAATASSCTDELRALLTGVHFDPGADYPAQIQDEHPAVYSLAGLITQTQ